MQRTSLTVTEDSAGRQYEAPMIRGFRWPFTGTQNVRLQYSVGWTPGVHDTTWTWRFRFHAAEGGGDVELTLTASNAVISGSDNEYLTLEISATAAQVNGIVGSGDRMLLVDLEGIPPSGDSSVWPMAFTATVRNRVGAT